MPITAHINLDRDTFEPAYQAPAADNPDNPHSIWGAAFRLENDIVNAIDFFENQRTYIPDPNFNLEEAAKQSRVYEFSPETFSMVRSKEEFQELELQVMQELRDRQTLAEGGWAGVGAAIAAGVVSPTILLPGGAAFRAPTVLKAAGSAAAWGMVAGGLSEIPLQANQRLRTQAETIGNIGSAAVLGGLLGAGIRKLDPVGWDRIVEDMDRSAAQGYISEVAEAYGVYGTVDPSAASMIDGSLSAARATPRDPLRRDPGKPLNMETALGRALTLSTISPVSRQLISDVPIMRSAMYQVSNAGLITRGNMTGISTDVGGDIESRAAGHHAAMAVALHKTQKFFQQWYQEVEQGSKFGSRFAFRAYGRFTQEVTNAALLKTYGGKVDNAVVAAAADEYLQFFSKTLREAKSVGMSGFTNLSDQDLMKIALQTVRKDIAIENNAELQSIVRIHVMRQLENPEVRKNQKVKEWLAREFDLVDSKVLSKIEYAKLVSEKIISKWTSTYSRHGTIDTLAGKLPVPYQLTIIDPRTTSVNGTPFSDFLEPDIERIARSFVRSMSGDIELQRVFKTVDPTGKEDPDAPLWTEIQNWEKDGLEQIKSEERKFMEKLQKEGLTPVQARAKARSKYGPRRKKLAKTVAAFERDFGVIVNRIRHKHGIPDDPYAMTFRLGRQILNVNTLRLMGSVVLSSVADLGRLVMKHGFVNVMRDGLVPLMSDWKTMKLAWSEAEYSGAALDIITHSRTNEMFDLFDDAGYGNFFERGMQTMTNKIGVVAGFDYWNDGLKKFTGALLIADISRALHAVNVGKDTKATRAFLGSIGIDSGMSKKLWAAYQNGGASEVRPGVWMPNTEDWGLVRGRDRYVLDEFRELEARDVMPEGLSKQQKVDFERLFNEDMQKAKEQEELKKVFRAALFRGITNTIIQPGVERPIWMDASTATRIIGQFRSFGMSSQFKTLVAASQSARLDAGGVAGMSKIGSGAMLSLAFGALSYYLWANSLDPLDTQKSAAKKRMQKEFDGAINGDMESLARIADEAIARSGLIGAFEEGRRVAERIPGLQDYVTLANTPTTRSPFVEPVTELLGPSVSLFKEMDTIARSGFKSNQGIESVQALMPYQNVFYLRAFFDALIDQTKEKVGVK